MGAGQPRYRVCEASDAPSVPPIPLLARDNRLRPTTIGYELVADCLLKEMKAQGVAFQSELDSEAIVQADTLVNDPPALLSNLRDTLAFLDKWGLLSSVFDQSPVILFSIAAISGVRRW